MTRPNPHGDSVPRGVHRRAFWTRERSHMVCTDERPYQLIEFTATDELVVGDYEPAAKVHRDSYVAHVSVYIAKHDDATHPADGCPTGSSAKFNIRRVTADESGDAAIMATDNVLEVAGNTHHDVATIDSTNFAIPRVYAGESVYVRIIAVGSTYPGRNARIAVELVPFRGGVGPRPTG